MPENSAVGVWSALLAAELVHPETYDKDLVAELTATFHFDPTSSFMDQLASSTVSATELLRALLSVLEPITAMLTDLLSLYAEIDARAADDENLRIEYEFEEGHPVDLLLSHFKQEVTKLTAAAREVRQIPISQDSLWSFPYGYDSWGTASKPHFETWRRSYVKDEQFQDFPRQTSTGDAELDDAVRRSEEIFAAVLKATRSYGTTRQDFRVFDDTERGVLATLHSDKWLSSAVLGLNDALEKQSGSDQRREITDALEEWLVQFRPWLASESVLVAVVESLLALPMWGKRYALYSAWLLTQIHSAVGGQLSYVVNDGKLRFPFGGALLATLNTVDGPMELWTEMRSELLEPKGSGRTNAIQPDYRFVLDRNAPSDTTVLAIEAKQYAKSVKRPHSHVLDDYTRGLPNAKVILAAYGPVSHFVLDSLPASQSGRAVVVRELRPQVVDAVREFAEEVVSALPEFERPALTYPLTVTLTWDPQVHDVDLHLFADGGPHIWWENLSDRGIRLMGHSVDGDPQVLEVDDSPEHKFSIWVHVYDHAPITAARPIISLSSGNERFEYRPTSPPPDVRSWHVLDLLPHGKLLVIDAFPPLPDCGAINGS